MELLQLRYFLALAESQHLTNTAKKLFISAPSLSLTITKLEKDLDTQLFERTGRSLSLNENGRIFYQYVKKALNALDSGVKALNIQVQEEYLSLALASPPIWNACIYDFQVAYPQIHLSTKCVSAEELQVISNWNYDFFLAITREIDRKKFDYKVICGEERPVVVMSKKHPLSNHASLNFRELREETFISIGNDVSSAHQYLLEMCKLADFEPKIIMAADYSFRVKLVEDNLGVTLTTDFAYPRNYNLPNDRICAIPISDPILTRTQAIAWRKGGTISNAGQKLMNFLFDYFR